METYQDMFYVLIMLVVAAAGSPISQLIKRGLSALLGKQVEDRWAIVVTGIVAGLVAILEMWLAGSLDFADITRENFPVMFFAVYGVASLYYSWFKGSDGKLGRGGLLK